MPITLKGGGAPTMRPWTKQDTGASLSHNYQTVQLSGGTTTTKVIGDGVFLSYTAATYTRNGRILVDGVVDPVFHVLNPTVGTVAADGEITRLSAGILKVRVRVGKITLPIDIDLTEVSDEVDQPDEFQSVVPGTLAAHLADQVDSRIDNTMTMNANGRIFSTQNHVTPNYVRNANLWCNDVDMTCISPWNSNNNHRKAGTLITPQHVLNAAHYPYGVGTVVRFVSNTGTVFDRTVIGVTNHPDYRPYYPDLRLCTLDSPLPADITPCKLLPADWSNYLKNNYSTRPASIGLDQEEKATIQDWNTNGSFLYPNDADRQLLFESKIGGDSGNPAFLLFNGELVLITVWTGGGAGSGSAVSLFIDDINGMIATADSRGGVSTGYTVTTADFSSYPLFLTENLMEDSDDVDAAYLGNSSTSPGEPDPLGGNTAALITSGGSSFSNVRAFPTNDLLLGQDYIYSIYLKAGTVTTCGIMIYNPSYGGLKNQGRYLFDLGAGSAQSLNGDGSPAAGFVDVGNGWYRLWVYASAPVKVQGDSIELYIYPGSPGSITAGKTLTAWRPQLNTGNVLQGYQSSP